MTIMPQTNRTDLFATCPKCRHKFAIPSRIVLRYLERLVSEVSMNLPQGKQGRRGSTRKG